MKFYWILIFVMLSTACEPAVVVEKLESPSPTPIVTDKIVIKEWEAKNVSLGQEINEAKERWIDKGIRSYEFIIRRDIGGMSSPWNRSPMFVRVRVGQPLAIEKVDKEDVSLPATTEGLDDFDTVDDLFEYMLRQLSLGEIVIAEYDDKIGFPKFITLKNTSHNHGIRSISILKFSDLSEKLQ